MGMYTLCPQKEKIILYGASTKGDVFYQIFIELGFNIIGFIDKRATEIKVKKGVPVWNTQDVPVIDDAVIVITIKNVFEHDEIVRCLLERGYHKIIYKPGYLLKGGRDEKLFYIDCAYESILAQRHSSKSKFKYPTIPCIDEIIEYEFKDYAVISQRDNSVIFFAPIEMIFYKENVTGERYKWAGKSILLLPHISLYSYFLGIDKTDVSKYIDFCEEGIRKGGIERTQGWEDAIIESRYMVFSEMCKQFDLDYDFFIRNAQDATWNEKGRFNICGGRHRLSFLCARGLHYVPIKVSIADYNCYINNCVLQEIVKYLHEEHINQYSVDIPHPYFYRLESEKRDFIHFVLLTLCQILMESFYESMNLENMTAMVFEGDVEIARHLDRCGCMVDIIPKKAVDLVLENLLNRLFFRYKVNFIKYIKRDKYDFAFFDFVDSDNESHYLDCSATVKVVLANETWFVSHKEYSIRKKFFKMSKRLAIGVRIDGDN